MYILLHLAVITGIVLYRSHIVDYRVLCVQRLEVLCVLDNFGRKRSCKILKR